MMRGQSRQVGPSGAKSRRIQHYQLLEVLGKGANGLVYRGLDTQRGSFVAVKEMVIGKSEARAIRSELTVLRGLEHPSVVRYIDALYRDNRIYLVLEFMEGGSLGSLAQKLSLGEDIVRLYVKQVLAGLSFLHSAGLVHRDIKGANILLTKEGRVKLADFGLAVRLEDSTKTISAAGSPYWIAP